MAYDEEYEDIEEKKESYMKNQAKSMAKDAGKKVAREAKKATKEALKQALKALFKLIGWKGLLIVGIVLAVIVILVAICAHIEIKDGSKDEGNPGNVPYVVSEAIRNSTVIKDENGNYSIGFTFEEDGKKTVLNYDESIDKIFKTLKENGDVLLQYLSEDVEKQKEYIKMFIEAEVATTYPKLGDSGLQGKIKIIRKTDDGKNIELKYIGKDEFDEKIKNGDTNIQNYFTLDENGALIVSSKEIINLKEIENGKTISDTTTVNITSSNPNNYKTSLRKYTLPFDYLWAMLVKTNDLQFMREISSLAKESEINIDIMEEKRITTSIVEKEHTVANIQKDEAYITVSFSDSSVETRYIDTDEYVINSSIYNYKNITTTEQIIPNIAVTYARTWIADYTNTYPESKIKSEFGSEDVELKNTGKKEQYSDAIKSDNTEKWYADQIWNNNVKSIKENWNKKIKYTKEDEFKEGSSTYTVEYKYGTPTSKLVEKTDKNSEEKNAVTLLVNSKNALETLKETGDWLYEMLEGNENADYMIDITKYLLYKATGKDYGVKELNLDKIGIFSNNSSNVGGSLAIFGEPDCTREEFIESAKKYKADNSRYQNNLAAHAGDFYDVCKKNNINPKFAYAHACLETGYGGGYADRFNYFGMAAYNDNPDNATSYSSPAESVQDYCNWVKNNVAKEENNSVAERLAAYREELKGTADTNIYVLYIRYAQLNSTHTGNDIGNPKIFAEDTGEVVCNHSEGDPTTDEEKAAYAVYTTNVRIEIMENIFGPIMGCSNSGDITKGIISVYKSSSGKTFTEFGQNIGTWADIPYAEGTIAHYGCSITSVSIALSGYGVILSPDQVLAKNSNFGVQGALQQEGITCDYGNKNHNDIINHLKKKGTVVVHVISPSIFTTSEHWMVLADVSADGKKVYVLDPWYGNPSGWRDISEIATLEDCLYLE